MDYASIARQGGRGEGGLNERRLHDAMHCMHSGTPRFLPPTGLGGGRIAGASDEETESYGHPHGDRSRAWQQTGQESPYAP